MDIRVEANAPNGIRYGFDAPADITDEEIDLQIKALMDEDERAKTKAKEHESKTDRKSTRLNSSHTDISRMPSSA